MNRYGIIGSGCLIVDNIKRIDYYPSKNMMCRIIDDVTVSVGGAAHNLLVNLSKLDNTLPLEVLGCIGNDEGGKRILKAFNDNSIKTDLVRKVDKDTSFTDVMIEISTGDRTFFSYTGANAELDFEQFTKAKYSNAKIFYMSLLRLKQLDQEDEEYGIGYAKVLSYLSDLGFKTAVDLVSIKSDIFSKIFQYCLKYVDYLIINELEAQSLTGLIIRADSNSDVNQENLEKSLIMLMKQGVRELVVIHMPEGCIAIDKNLIQYKQDCYNVDKANIVSTVGCGDAFNAGVLYSLHQDMSIEEALKVGNACARFCLFNLSAAGGAVSLQVVKEFIKSFEQGIGL
jgi:sugar/nucleoside kinase (ribokinase family)